MNKKNLKRLLSVVLLLSIILGSTSVSPQLAYAADDYVPIVETGKTITLSSAVSINSLGKFCTYFCDAKFTQSGIVKFTLTGASTVELIEIHNVDKYELIGRYTNYNGYSNCSFTADLKKGVNYEISFHTNSEKSSKTFKCVAAMNEDVYTSTSDGCIWYANNQKNAPSVINYTSVEFYSKEQVMLLYIRQDSSIRNKLLDGTYAVVSSAALVYACQSVPALKKAAEALDDNILKKIVTTAVGTTSIAAFFNAPFTTLEKSMIEKYSNNFTTGIIRKNYVTPINGGVGHSYATWTTYPKAYGPTGFTGYWEAESIVK